MKTERPTGFGEVWAGGLSKIGVRVVVLAVRPHPRGEGYQTIAANLWSDAWVTVSTDHDWERLA